MQDPSEISDVHLQDAGHSVRLNSDRFVHTLQKRHYTEQQSQVMSALCMP